MIRKISCLFFVSCLFTLTPLYAASTQTFTTYYPAPQGNYNKMTINDDLTFSSQTTNCTASTGGPVNLVNVSGQLEICDKNGIVSFVQPGGLWQYPGATYILPQTSATNVGIGVWGADPGVKLGVNGTTSLTGNVGIGVTAGGNTLTVQTSTNTLDQVKITDGTNWMGIFPGTVVSGDWNGLVQAGDNSIIYSDGSAGTGALTISPWAGATSGIRMNSNGNVGIGLTTPGANLAVLGAGTGAGLIGSNGCGGNYTAISLNGNADTSCGNFYNILSSPTDPTLYLNRPTGDWIKFRENNGTEMNIAPGGSVGIGVGDATPAQKLEVNGIAQIDSSIFAAGGVSLGNVGNRQALWLAGSGDCNHAIYSDYSSPCGYTSPTGNNDTEYFDYFEGLVFQPRIGGTASYFNPSGNLVMTQDLFVNENWSPDQAIEINSNQIWKGVTTGDSTLYFQWSVNNGAVQVGGQSGFNNNLNVQGNIAATGTITASSDQRLKQNIMPLTDTLSKLDQLRGVSFEWNHLASSVGLKEGQKNIGMIAQELQKVYPELVVSSKNGSKEYLSIDYGKFTAVLLQSVKELKSQMGVMQEQINSLQEKVKILEKQK